VRTHLNAYVFVENPGVNTFEIRMSRSAGNGTLNVLGVELVAIFSPFGPEGAGLGLTVP
jgi:hypothetical protein